MGISHKSIAKDHGSHLCLRVRTGRPIGAHKLDGATPERVVLLDVEAQRREEARGVLLRGQRGDLGQVPEADGPQVRGELRLGLRASEASAKEELAD